MGLLSAGITALFARDSSYLPSFPNISSMARLPDPRAFVSGRTVFFGLVCLTVILILAYLTNPSEASFRTFLTEQVFRRHLHKLHAEDTEGDADPESLELTSSANVTRHTKGKRYSLSHKIYKSAPGTLFGRGASPTLSKPPRVHFTSRLAISLQTPAHIFRTYGVCTIAVTQQIDTTSPFGCMLSSCEHAACSGRVAQNGTVTEAKVRGTWYIGAFGRWWIGGDLEFLREDLMAIANTGSSTSGQEAGKTQGDLKGGHYNVKVLDDAFAGLPITRPTPTIDTTSQAESSTTAIKTRSRASTRSVKQTVTPISSRSSTPPPALSRTINVAGPSQADHSTTGRKSRSNSNVNPLQSTEDSHPPEVTKIIQEIAKSQAAVLELRDQLTAFQSQTFASQSLLRLALEEQRDRKKQEDAVRLDVKTRTKALEESKRNADAGKHNADKKLKAAQTAHDSAINRMQRLSSEIAAMHQRMENGDEKRQKSQQEVALMEAQSVADMEAKRSESKALEDVVGELTGQAKDLEETLAKERERLTELKEEVEKKRHQYQKQQEAALFLALQMQQRAAAGGGFPSMEDIGLGTSQVPWNMFNHIQNYAQGLPQSHLPNFIPLEALTSFVQPPRRLSGELGPNLLESSAVAPAVAPSSRYRSLSLGELSNIPPPAPIFPSVAESRPSLNPGDDGFSPFDVDDRERVPPLPSSNSFSSLSSVAAGLLPTNLVNSMETESPISLLPPTDAPEPRGSSESRWKTSMWPFKSESLSKSTPTSNSVPTTKRRFDPFDLYHIRSKTTPEDGDEASQPPESNKTQGSVAKKWFSKSASATMSENVEIPSQTVSAPEGAMLVSKSSLNPDAKVFSLPKGRSLLSSTLWTHGGMAPLPPTNVRPGTFSIHPPADILSSLSSTASLPLPPPSSNGSEIVSAAPSSKPRFRGLFTSPFAPSPAEREALQRALEKNLSHDRISVTSDGSGDARMPPSPFGITVPTASLFDVDEEDADSGWGKVLKSAANRKGSIGEGIARQTTR